MRQEAQHILPRNVYSSRVVVTIGGLLAQKICHPREQGLAFLDQADKDHDPADAKADERDEPYKAVHGV